METKQLILEHESPFDVAATVEKIINEAEKNNWQIPAVHNLQQSMAKSGKTVKPVQVIEMCKPEYSGRLLEKNHERIASVMMPCRISVYEKDDGKAYVSILNISVFPENIPPVIYEAMKAASDETFEIIKSVIKSK